MEWDIFTQSGAQGHCSMVQRGLYCHFTYIGKPTAKPMRLILVGQTGFCPLGLPDREGYLQTKLAAAHLPELEGSRCILLPFVPKQVALWQQGQPIRDLASLLQASAHRAWDGSGDWFLVWQ